VVYTAPHTLGDIMQYWKKPNKGKIERLEEDTFKKHPEKLESLKNKGYQRVTGESDWSPYKSPTTAKKAVKKIKKKFKKS
tara:strand:+ start:527 stop:766 length:240 start_codon:yes stop_codon:yes gene_type:complete